MKSISQAFVGVALFPRCPFAEIGTVLQRFQVNVKMMTTDHCLRDSLNATLRFGALSSRKNLEIVPGYYRVQFPNHHQSYTYFCQLFLFSNHLGLEQTPGIHEIESLYLSHMMHRMATNLTSPTMVDQLTWVFEIMLITEKSSEQHFETPPKIWPGQRPSAHFRCSSCAMYCVVVVGAGVVVVVA